MLPPVCWNVVDAVRRGMEPEAFASAWQTTLTSATSSRAVSVLEP